MNADAFRSLLLQVLVWGALPLWILAGFGDWMCHRRTRIERLSGAPESAMHVGLYVLMVVPVVGGLYLEVDALVLAIMAACVAAHTVLAWVDTAYTRPRREITAVEQAFHPWLELLPVFALVVVGAWYADAWRAPDWALRVRAQPLPAWARYGVPLALLPGLLLTLEEWARCRRAAGAERVARSAPESTPG